MLERMFDVMRFTKGNDLLRCTTNPVGRVRGNLRESSTPGKGICGRLPSRDKTENGPPNQLGSDVPRIVRGRRLLPIARPEPQRVTHSGVPPY